MLSMKTVALSVFVWLAAGSCAFADVRLTFRDGHVSIVAKDATVGQILTEWAKIGQTKVVNVERMPRAPLSIELENVSEERALDVMFRELSGYMAAPRAIAVPNASRFDRIIVVPASSVRPGSAAPPVANVSASAYQAPAYTQPQAAYVPPPPADDTANGASRATGASRANGANSVTGVTGANVVNTATDVNSANDVNDEPMSTTVGGANPSVDQREPVPGAGRQQLETVDPRKFGLGMQQPHAGLPMAPPTGSLLRGGGVSAPGMIVKPTPPPR